jgi:hypothetical protein
MFPSLHRILPLTVGLLGGAILGIRLVRHPPADVTGVLMITGWVTLIAFMLAPATRVGYLLYPVNFFVWSRLLRDPSPAPGEIEPSTGVLAASTF